MERYNYLVEKKLELEENSIKIKSQIESAKSKFLVTGEKSDPIWFNKAKYSLEMTKLELKKINAEYEKHKREIKNEKTEKKVELSKTFERTFMSVAKDILSEEEYLLILNKTKELIFE